MKRFAELLDRLSYEPSRNNKLRLMTDYFRSTPDPDRGYALAALTGALSFQYAKPNVLRTLIDRAHRSGAVRPVARLCRRHFGDDRADVAGRSARIARMPRCRSPTSSTTLSTLGKAQLPAQLARWLDALDETGRWALLKLVTGALRVGVSARLAKTAAAALGDKDVHEIELLWPGLTPPYTELFAWLEGRADKPSTQRSGAVPSGDAGACDRRDRISPRSIPPTSRGMEMGRHPRAGVAARRRRRRAALFAHRRGHLQELSRPHRGARASTARSTANCWSCARAACRASTCCSSGSTANPSRQS